MMNFVVGMGNCWCLLFSSSSRLFLENILQVF